ncbi:MAG TPA: restriction endonuclease subunit S [Anaerolineae bacterium]|nr:restriction endonuclease subunit S [Anaerolineae bacterium]HQM13591.1 restriction endonuclease subunit S [Anaerolineae bacterium]
MNESKYERGGASPQSNGFREGTGEALPHPDLGPLPEDWQVVRLGEVAQIEMGQSPPSITYNSSGVGLPFFQGKADFGDIHPTTRKWCSSPGKIAEKNDILLSVRAPIGDVNIATQRCCIGRGLAAIRAGTKSESEYLFYHLLFSQEFLESKGTGTTFKQINKETVINFLIPLPPLPEQRAIARVLTAIQRAIEATEQVIAAARELKKSLMRHLFTYGPVPVGAQRAVGARFPVGAQRAVPQQETEIGPLPAHWQVVRMGEVANKPEYGYTASAVSDVVGPKFLRITDIQNGIVNWATVPYCQCLKDDEQRYKLETGDILIARIGATTGKTYLVKDCPSSIFASYLIRIRCKSTLLPDFLSQLAETQIYWDQINASKGGRLKQGVNIPVLQNLLLPLPPLPEQRAIAEMLRAVDEKIQAEENRKAALQSLFRSMLHHLMTGKVRVWAQRRCAPTTEA